MCHQDDDFARRLAAGFRMLGEAHPDEPVDEDYDGPVADAIDLEQLEERIAKEEDYDGEVGDQDQKEP